MVYSNSLLKGCEKSELNKSVSYLDSSELQNELTFQGCQGECFTGPGVVTPEVTFEMSILSGVFRSEHFYSCLRFSESESTF